MCLCGLARSATFEEQFFFGILEANGTETASVMMASGSRRGADRVGAAHQCHTDTFVLRTVQHLRRMVRGPPVSGTAARAAFNPVTAVATLSSEPARGLLRGGVVWRLEPDG